MNKHTFEIMWNETMRQIEEGIADAADLPFYISDDETGDNLGETTWDCSNCTDSCPFDCDYMEENGMHYDSYHGWIGDDV